MYLYTEQPVRISRERNVTWDDVVRDQLSSGTLVVASADHEHERPPRPPPRHPNRKSPTHRLLAGGRALPLGCIARHRVAVIVPFRARHQHLTAFVAHLHPFLRSQLLDFIIVVVEQVTPGG